MRRTTHHVLPASHRPMPRGYFLYAIGPAARSDPRSLASLARSRESHSDARPRRRRQAAPPGASATLEGVGERTPGPCAVALPAPRGAGRRACGGGVALRPPAGCAPAAPPCQRSGALPHRWRLENQTLINGIARKITLNMKPERTRSRLSTPSRAPDATRGPREFRGGGGKRKTRARARRGGNSAAAFGCVAMGDPGRARARFARGDSVKKR